MPRNVVRAFNIALLCQWAGAQVASSNVVLPDGSGGFWKLIVDTNGNVGTMTDAGPATADVILSDGIGFWKVIADTNGNRGATTDLGPATTAPVLTDSLGNYWQLVVDTLGNLGATLIP